MFKLILLLSILVLFKSTETSNIANDSLINGETLIGQKWLQIEQIFRNFYSNFAQKNVYPLLQNASIRANVSAKCRKSINVLIKDASNLEKWAIQSK